jgi:hypothetical protein
LPAGLARNITAVKNRKGAFLEDRYHATAIESGDHLWRCLVYVDLNMVRVGVVAHPSGWRWSGFHEIQNPKSRYRLIDHEILRGFLNLKDQDELAKTHQGWIESQLKGRPTRQAHFSKSIAVGSRIFVERIREQLKACALGRRTVELPSKGEGYQLKEAVVKYGDTSSETAKSDGRLFHFTNAIPWEEGIL